jgi:hypothetical protein
VRSLSWQDAEKVRRQRSRIVQILNVPQRVRLGPSLAAALPDGLFEHPAGVFSSCATRVGHRIFNLQEVYFRILSEAWDRPSSALLA